MSASLTDIHTLRDAIALPAAQDETLYARAERRDQYPIIVTQTVEVAVRRLVDQLPNGKAALVTDDTVMRLHGRRVASLLRDHGVDLMATSVAPGEGSKSLPVATRLLDWLAHSSIGRRDVIVALGGGVINDTVGWVASAYMRGVPYVNMPTTLLAHVDAALGGKVAVDHDVAKNLIGAFYQPAAVISSVDFLVTLDQRQLRAGLAEAVKKAIIASPDLFAFIEERLESILAADLADLEHLVRYASAIKAELIARDPYEQDLRRPLNFGHTVGHAVETITGYGPVLHGEAVAFGMATAARIARRRGWLPQGVYDRILTLLERAGLPVDAHRLEVPVKAHEVVQALEKIRLIRDGRLRFVLPLTLGETAIADDVTDEEIIDALCELGAVAR